MSTFIVHIHSGPTDRAALNKATLGLLVARTCVSEGHIVSIFLAGDAIEILDEKHADCEGIGTGRIGDHLAALRETQMYVSKKSTEARGYTDGRAGKGKTSQKDLIAGYNATYAMPSKLVELVAKADTVLCY